jgi:hypothetical protein
MKGLLLKNGTSVKRFLAVVFSAFLIILGVVLLFPIEIKGNNFILLQQIIGGSFFLIGTLLALSTSEKSKLIEQKENNQ